MSQEKCFMASVAEAHLREAMATPATSHMTCLDN